MEFITTWAERVTKCEQEAQLNFYQSKLLGNERFKPWAVSQDIRCTPYFLRAFKWFCQRHNQSAVMRAALLSFKFPAQGVPIIPKEFTTPITEKLVLKKNVIITIQTEASSWREWFADQVAPRYVMESFFWSVLFGLAETHPDLMRQHGFGWPSDDRMKHARTAYYKTNPRELGPIITGFTPVGGYTDAHIYVTGRGLRKTRPVCDAPQPSQSQEVAEQLWKLNARYAELKQEERKVRAEIYRLKKVTRPTAPTTTPPPDSPTQTVSPPPVASLEPSTPPPEPTQTATPDTPAVNNVAERVERKKTEQAPLF